MNGKNSTHDESSRKRRNDIVLIVVVIAVALAAWFGMRGGFAVGGASGSTSANATGPYAVVQNTEGERDVLPLSQDARLDVVSSKGENVIVVSGGTVCVEEADCKNQICVQTGKVKTVGDSIVCLPHQLVVQVVNDPNDASQVQGLLGQ